MQKGLTNGAAQDELAKFRDHWAAKTGQDATKADWMAAWRNWVRKAIEFRRTAGPATDGSATATAELERSRSWLAQQEADRRASQTPEAKAAAAAALARLQTMRGGVS